MHQPFWTSVSASCRRLRVYYDVDGGQRKLSILRVLKKEQGETAGSFSDEAD